MMLSGKHGVLIGLLLLGFQVQAQYWQQRADYTMSIDFDVETHRFEGSQTLVYTNNSPDTLKRVFYHLYFNAFQPGSMMDVRSRTISDPDRRVGGRIARLKENEIGYHKIKSLSQNGKAVKYVVDGTILEVELAEPIAPGKKSAFAMNFRSQVPVQIRRSGRNNSEGISYSMTQWYPKMAEYDRDGWHANPYVGREFHGVWGSFNVEIKIDSTYTVGGTGYLQNPQEIGHGYADASKPVKRPDNAKLSWRFQAPSVHDFAWAADPDFVHKTAQVPNGPLLHFLYQDDTLAAQWDSLRPYAVKLFQIMNRHFGKYPYKQFSVIQGGDGGMEYPMATLITGHGSFGGLVSVTVHEAIHNWYYGVLATNESKYPWMDEGFTSYAQNIVLDRVFKRNRKNPQTRAFGGYLRFVKSGLQEPITTHADHYKTNRAYGSSSYSKGAVFLAQMRYIIGAEAFDRGMIRYFNEWAFKHPTPTDFKRVMERESGIELDWYLEHWIGTTNTIDYGIKAVSGAKKSTTITLENAGSMPMPLDLVITFKDDKRKPVCYNIPLRIMRGAKPDQNLGWEWYTASDWPWTYPEYELEVPFGFEEIAEITINPLGFLADTDRSNNVFPAPSNTRMEGTITE